MVAYMFVRRTSTRSSRSGETYFTYRLVRTERVGGRVRQLTLLNLGRHFGLAAEQWPEFCARLGEIISPQGVIVPVEVSAEVESAAQRYAAQLRPRENVVPPPSPTLETVLASSDRVHAETMELTDVRSVGVEALALYAMNELGIAEELRVSGMNRVSVAAAVGQIVARMAHPASERTTHAWLQRRSALGELSDFDYERLSLTRLYRVADALWGEHERVERALHARLCTVFGLSDTVALYDLTNTYFEGLAQHNPQARRGHSKEKRSDAPLITLGLVLDGAGFVRRSQVFAGNVRESVTLQGMFDGLAAPAGSLVVCDRGIVSEDNLRWLRERGYRYLVMSFRTAEGDATLHVRKTSAPEAEAVAIYAALGLDPRPGGVKKRRFHHGSDL
ncbi:hypothetical protein AGMMS50256_30620 [Betaproteobacteria bacterium]|nr:hypothetical protein AGMMS50256_30620 [Betaproteobacteria bacterium]